jgi:hypothetical protein
MTNVLLIDPSIPNSKDIDSNQVDSHISRIRAKIDSFLYNKYLSNFFIIIILQSIFNLINIYK